MRAFRLLPALLLVLGPICLAQSGVLRIEPATPVAQTQDDPGTTLLRFTYFPGKAGARFQQPVLLVGVNGRFFRNNTHAVPFVRKSTATWEAKLDRGKNEFWLYLIFAVQDGATHQIDNNGGRYWDVLFRSPTGPLHSQAVELQAESYTGARFDNGIDRSLDFAKATSILEAYLASSAPDRFNVLSEYWDDKVRRDGNNDEVWRKLAREIDDFIDEHRLDHAALVGAANFVVLRDNRLPPQIQPKLLNYLAAMDRKDADTFLRMALFNRIQGERNQGKRAQALQEFVSKYPDDPQTPLAVDELFLIRWEEGDVAGAEAAFNRRAQLNPSWPDTYAAMAAVYIENNVKLDQALLLLKKAQEVQAGHPEGGHSLWVLSPDSSRNAAILAYWRARAYVEQGRPQLALPLLEQVLAGRKTSNIYFLAAQIYEAAGEKQKAVDACTQAVLLPSNRHLEQMNKLRELWVSGGFGSEQQLQQKIRQAKDERFREKHYVANLVDRPMPEFEFLTLKGQKLTSSDLRGKTLVLGVWATSCAPCLPELPQLQELQERHSDVLVLAIAVDSEPGVISRIVQKQGLQTLQIGVGNEHVRDVLAPQGLPSTYVIERGRIRVTHLGALDDMVAYLEADLAALGHKQ